MVVEAFCPRILTSTKHSNLKFHIPAHLPVFSQWPAPSSTRVPSEKKPPPTANITPFRLRGLRDLGPEVREQLQLRALRLQQLAPRNSPLGEALRRASCGGGEGFFKGEALGLLVFQGKPPLNVFFLFGYIYIYIWSETGKASPVWFLSKASLALFCFLSEEPRNQKGKVVCFRNLGRPKGNRWSSPERETHKMPGRLSLDLGRGNLAFAMICFFVWPKGLIALLVLHCMAPSPSLGFCLSYPMEPDVTSNLGCC